MTEKTQKRKSRNPWDKKYKEKVSREKRDINSLIEEYEIDELRRKPCKFDLKLFCETYLPGQFFMAWSIDHLRVIEKIEIAILKGGQFAVAMPRGSGKSTICIAACIWAILFGHRKFIVLVCATDELAVNLLTNMKVILENNEQLINDFKWALAPIKALEGLTLRTKGQTYDGDRTNIKWTTDKITFPTIVNSLCSGSMVACSGITGAIRGLVASRTDGTQMRPDFVTIDDPQTDKSAKSLTQSSDREKIIKGAIMGLSGPKTKIAAIMPCTVIAPGDLSDRILDHKENPKWRGERSKMLLTFPKNMKLWDQYDEIRNEDILETGEAKKANIFYQHNKKLMDESASVSWECRYFEDEISAIQHAMNRYFDSEITFFSEYQNEPIPESIGEDDDITIDGLMQKLNGYQRYEIPQDCTTLTCFIDVQKNLLYYVIAAFAPDFTGYIIDYDAYPKQNRRHFFYRNARPELKDKHKGGLEAQIFQGLKSLCKDLLSKEYQRDDGARMRIDRTLIDANWGDSTNTVYRFCRQSEHPNLLPSHGIGLTASSIAFSQYKRKGGDKIGDNWRVPRVRKQRLIRHLVFDTNYWKTQTHIRLVTPLGDKSNLSLYGRKPYEHRTLVSHLTSEFSVKTTGRGREVREWKKRTNIPDNHWWDCLVGCCVAASMEGIIIEDTNFKRLEKRKKIIKPSQYIAAKQGVQIQSVYTTSSTTAVETKTPKNRLTNKISFEDL